MRTRNLEARSNGGKAAPYRDNWWWLVIAIIGIVVLLAVLTPDPYWRIIKFVSDGILVSIGVTAVAFVLTLVLGLLTALGRLSKIGIINWVTTIYVEIARGVPLLVQLLFWYFAFPSLIQSFGKLIHFEPFERYLANPYFMAILGLTFCYAAYMSEIYRAGIQSISKGQNEAARSLGMTHGQAMRYIILPQAIKVILPPVGNEFISLLKDSSLVSVVSVADMTRRGREFMAANFLPVETWLMVALLYLIMTLISARLVAWIERKTKTEER
ncbi:MAG: amino acid ABC transporter permease [Anaerolineaceae bacterium]|jgi:polar amino acid transport system permease protein|nr:amino acid ABC transporter permease [Anaerolineaceae bacterium]